MFRKIIFWSHLVSGVLAGIVVLTMSFTGVILTYERQMLNWLEEQDYLPAEQQSNRLSLEQLTLIARSTQPELNLDSVVVRNHAGAPVQFSAGRSGSVNLNPYSGEEMTVGSPGLDAFFSDITGFHRWFNMTGESRGPARAITGASNLIFLFLILSGMYLWLPKIWQWALFKTRLLFRRSYPDAKARDFAWHHIFGIWSAIPLAVIVATASVFYYSWANDLVYIVFGDPSPSNSSTVTAANAANSEFLGSMNNVQVAQFKSLDELLSNATDYMENWEVASIQLPEANQVLVEVSVDQGNGGQPQYRNTLNLDRSTGQVISHVPFTSEAPGRQARTIIRYLHTGEVLGIWGQTIAGLVSLTSLFMVWTGLALAYRRLIVPLLNRRS